jgi:hypothetical protein
LIGKFLGEDLVHKFQARIIGKAFFFKVKQNLITTFSDSIFFREMFQLAIITFSYW